jgi:nicotinamidase-related amidase
MTSCQRLSQQPGNHFGIVNGLCHRPDQFTRFNKAFQPDSAGSFYIYSGVSSYRSETQMDSRYHCLLDSSESVVMLMDFQQRVLQAIGSHATGVSAGNALRLVKAAKAFGIPVVASTIDQNGFGGSFLPELHALIEKPVIDRTCMSPWENSEFRSCVAGYGRNKIVIAGAWTGVSVCSSAIFATAEGYEVYVVTDACGDVSAEAHERAIQRLVQAGVTPMTSIQTIFEWQRDLTRETAAEVLEIAAFGSSGQ